MVFFVMISWQNDERMHPYQRRRASITELGLLSGKIIETERLVGVAVARLVLRSFVREGRVPPHRRILRNPCGAKVVHLGISRDGTCIHGRMIESPKGA